MINSVFGKIMKNIRKHKDNKLVTTQRRRNYLVSEPIHHTTKGFSENLLAIEIRKTKIINEPVYLGLSIFSKVAIYEFWCGYIKPR